MAKIFVSYSRKDSQAAKKIILALKDIGLDVWVDWEDIPPAADWMDQIKSGIENVEAFIFLISPDSAISGYCTDEINHAEKNKKRIIPVVIRFARPEDTVDIIRKLNWTFLREEDNFDEGIAKIKTAIELDLEWVQEHNRLQARALEWHRKKDPSLLLRGRDLRNARNLVMTTSKKDPVPTTLQQTYIHTSNRDERRRTFLWSATIIAVLIMAFLSYATVTQSKLATKNEKDAIENQRKAEVNAAKAAVNAKKAIREKQAAEKAKKDALDARDAAEVSKNLASAQRSAAQAQIYQYRPGELYTSTLLAIDSWQTRPSDEAEEILRKNISLLPIPVAQMTHAGKINNAEFNSEGDVFVTAGADGSACVWQASDGKNLFCVDSPGAVSDAVFSPIEKIIITGDDKGNIQIVNAETGTIEQQLSVGSSIRDVDIQKSGRFAAVTSDNGRVTLIDLKIRAKSGIALNGTNIKLAAFSPNGLQVATGSSNGLVSLWTLNQTDKPRETRKHNGEILTLEFSPNGFYLVTGGVDGAVVVTETKTGVEKFRVNHDDQVKDIAFSPDGNWFVTVSNDRKIRVWDINNGRQILSMSQNNFIQTVKVSANGQWIATTGDDKTVRVWNASTGTELFQIPIKGKGSVLGFSRDGKYLIAGDQSGFINIWDTSTLPTPINYLQFTGVTTSALYSPTGNWIAVSDDRRIWLLNPRTLSKLITRPQGNALAELRSNINKIMFSPKDKWIGVLTAGNEMVLYNQNGSGKTLRPTGFIQAFVFSPDEKQLITGDSAGSLQIWDTATGKLLSTPIANGRRITAMAASSTLLALGMDNELHILDINTLQELTTPQSNGDLELLAFSPDGSRLVSSNSTGQIQVWVWSQTDGKFADPKASVKSTAFALAFNPTNSLLAVAASDKVYLINPDTLEEYARIPHTGTVSSIAFSTDGLTLMTSSLKVIQFWDITKIQEIKKESIVETACRHLVENLTRDQWNILFGAEDYRPLCENLTIPE